MAIFCLYCVRFVRSTNSSQLKCVFTNKRCYIVTKCETKRTINKSNFDDHNYIVNVSLRSSSQLVLSNEFPT